MSPLPRAPSRRPPTSFSALPRELLPYIARDLDRASSLAFARVSRDCTSHAERGIWRDLDLFLPPGYREHSSRISPYPAVGNNPQSRGRAGIEEVEEGEEGDADEAHRAALRKRSTDIMMAIDHRKVQMVETAEVVPIVGTHPQMITMLNTISPHLQALYIEAPPDHFYGSRQDPAWAAQAHESFDVSVIGQGLTFPSLRHLHIGVNAARYVDFIYLLCCAATSLTSLYVAPHDSFTQPPDVPQSLRYPPFGAWTSLEQIHLSFDRGSNLISDVSASQLIALVFFGPELKQLSMNLVPTSIRDLLLELSPELPKLEDLYWQEEAVSVHRLFDGPEKPFTSVERLVVESIKWQDMLVPQLPNLEILFFKNDHQHPPILLPEFPPLAGDMSESIASPMIPTFAASLSYSPHLHAIHQLTTFDEEASDQLEMFAEMDRIELAGKFTGVVRSFTHGIEAELFHARFFLPYLETSDLPSTPALPSNDLQTTLPYTAHDGSERVKVFDRLDSPVYQHYTYFDELCVPLGIIERMREVQGASEEEWRGRGVEVGIEAWQVLLEWKGQQVAEEAAVGAVVGGGNASSEAEDANE